MRRNRLKWIQVSNADTTGGTWQLTAPNVYRRVVALIVSFAAGSANEPIVIGFKQRDGSASKELAQVLSGDPGAGGSGIANFVLGGASVGSASGWVSGPLPDIWFGPDLVVTVQPNAFSGADFTDMRILVEECDLSEG